MIPLPKPAKTKPLMVEVDEELLTWVKKHKGKQVSLKEIVEWGLKNWQDKMLLVLDDVSKLKK